MPITRQGFKRPKRSRFSPSRSAKASAKRRPKLKVPTNAAEGVSQSMDRSLSLAMGLLSGNGGGKS